MPSLIVALPTSTLTRQLFNAFAVVAVVLTAAAHAEKWDMPMSYADESYQTMLGRRFAQAVFKATDEELEIKIHSDGSLYPGSEIKEAVKTGKVQIGERLLSSHQDENIIYGFDSVPFLTESFEDVDLLWDVARPAIEKALADEGLVLLYSVPFPLQGLFFNEAVDKMQDLQGRRLRVYNETGRKMAELMDMEPVNIEQSRLVEALNNGEVEAAITSASTGYDRELWKYFYRYYTLNSWAPRAYVFVNKDAWDDLPPQTQSAIKEIGRLIEELGAIQVKQLTQWLEDRLAENNLAVEEPVEMFRGQLDEIGEQMRQEWINEAGDGGEWLINEYLKRRG